MQPEMQIALAVFMAGKMPPPDEKIKPETAEPYCGVGAPSNFGSEKQAVTMPLARPTRPS